ncbi:MAG: cellulase family glycosylhydrolase [Candidatus Omnitrophota bacterium]
MEMKRLTGVNLGGWLLMEGYILGGRNIAEHEFKRKFARAYGKKELIEFEKAFRESYITENDFKTIASWGANCVRLPFHYKFFETKPYKYDARALAFMKNVLGWAESAGLKVILDLHAARGAQNCDWHADSDGRARLWTDAECRNRTYALWEFLAHNMKDEPAVCGYDVLNEPVIRDAARVKTLKGFYRELIRRIKRIDRKRAIFLEGNIWAQEIDFIKDILEDNVAVSIHTYLPLNFTFNFRREYSYPGQIEGIRWDRDTLRRHLEKYKKFSDENKTRIFVGEFGVNYRKNAYGELAWLGDSLAVFGEYGFDWTYWTYKAVAGPAFPDGIVQYIDNPGWVRREGPVFGIENLYHLWRAERKEIIRSWDTANFSVNDNIVNVLKQHFA